MSGVFWGSLAAVGYTYLLFPLILAARALLRPAGGTARSGPATPSLSMIIAVHNEARVIGHKLRNIAALDYPAQRLEVIVASDGSSDDTEAVARSHADGLTLELLSLPRTGKAAALNAAAARAKGELLVFSDANSIFAANALRELTAPFADPRVGGVAGNQAYRLAEGSTGTAEGEARYWAVDRLWKALESRGGNVVSATGAIYAIRRELFEPVPPGVTDDFVISTGVIASGYRLVFAPEAVAYEPVSGSRRGEWDRKVRVMTRGLRAVYVRRELLDPLRHGFYAVQLISHKLLRRMVPIPLIALAIASPLLWDRGMVYRVATLAQAGLYGAAAIGLIAPRSAIGRHRLFALPAYFCLVNAAALMALLNLVRGRRIDRWEPSGSAARRAE